MPSRRRKFGMETYAAARGERVLAPFVATSLFPYLASRSRRAFRIGLAALLLVMIVLALLRLQAPLIAVCVLGLPLLFVLYLYEIGVQPELTMRSLVPTAVLGAALGIGFALLTAALPARYYDVSLDETPLDGQTLLIGVAIPIGVAVLMLLPVVTMRLVHPTRPLMDGFLIGAVGAIGFTAASTLTRLAPQFATGMIAGDRPVVVLFLQAGLQGVAVPVISTSLGGLVGATLWLGRWKLIMSSVLTTLVVYGGLGLMELVVRLEGLQFVVYVVVTVLALLALRIGLHIALLHEGHVPTSDEDGVAARQAAHGWLYKTLAAGVAAAAAMGVTAAALATPARPKYACPPDCGRPPIGEPVDLNPRFFSADQRFSVQYPSPESAYEVNLQPEGVDLEFTAGDTGSMQLFGQAADNRTPKQILDDLIGKSYPEATVAYEIPNAMVGYEPGYGVVLDEYPQDPSVGFTRLRIVALCAVKNDYALVAAAIGPYHEFTPDFGAGHPSGVNLALALDMGKYVNSFRWRSGPTG